MEKRWHKIAVSVDPGDLDILTGVIASRYTVEGVEESTDGASGYIIASFFVPYSPDNELRTETLKKLIENIIPVHGLNIETYDYDPAVETEWKKHFKPSPVGKNIIIRPSWEPVPEDNNRIVITIDPGIAFGTGIHGTTKGVIILMEEYILSKSLKEKLSLLDAGTGSGILAIVAYKLGIKNIKGFDIDGDSVKTASENLLINGIEKGVKLSVSDITSHEGVYDIVLVNMLSEILSANSKKLLSFVKPGGALILSGLLDNEADSVLKIFTGQGGLSLIKRISIDNWSTIRLG